MVEIVPKLPCDFPAVPAMSGRTVDLELAAPALHGADLWPAIGADPALWALIPPGPFDDRAAFMNWLADRASRPDAVLYAIIDKAEGRRAAGLYFLLNVDTAMGVLEIGLVYGPALRRRVQGTEAFFLIAGTVFERLGYRRLEWRCNPDNLASREAALRYGFTFEGLMRQSLWVKGRNWDTALYAMTDGDWFAVAPRLRAWLAPDNFGPDGRQFSKLNPG
jgi:RimJ/RimL family protein N-acetyltransferase